MTFECWTSGSQGMDRDIYLETRTDRFHYRFSWLYVLYVPQFEVQAWATGSPWVAICVQSTAASLSTVALHESSEFPRWVSFKKTIAFLIAIFIVKHPGSKNRTRLLARHWVASSQLSATAEGAKWGPDGGWLSTVWGEGCCSLHGAKLQWVTLRTVASGSCLRVSSVSGEAWRVLLCFAVSDQVPSDSELLCYSGFSRTLLIH